MRPATLGILLLLTACEGFTEVTDSRPADAGGDGLPADAGGDGPPQEGGPTDDGPPTDSKPTDDGPPKDSKPSPDLGGKRPAGDCCAKNGDCLSDLCSQLGTGPTYCNKVCTIAPDDCPVGFHCDPSSNHCMPPSSGGYQCGSHVVNASVQPMGGCCGKLQDCQSGKCISVGVGAFFCTQTCSTQPDDCPVGYVCSASNICGTPDVSTCQYH